MVRPGLPCVHRERVGRQIIQRCLARVTCRDDARRSQGSGTPWEQGQAGLAAEYGWIVFCQGQGYSGKFQVAFVTIQSLCTSGSKTPAGAANVHHGAAPGEEQNAHNKNNDGGYRSCAESGPGGLREKQAAAIPPSGSAQLAEQAQQHAEHAEPDTRTTLAALAATIEAAGASQS